MSALLRALIAEALGRRSRRSHAYPGAKPQLHGMHHRAKCVDVASGEQLIADTTSDSDYVVLSSAADGSPRWRASKWPDGGHVYSQGTNPDYEGHDSYSLDRFDAERGEWDTWDSNARARAFSGKIDKLPTRERAHPALRRAVNSGAARE